MIGHIAPEAMERGPIALVKDGDKAGIDAQERLVDLEISPMQMSKRREEAWRTPEPWVEKGMLRKYASLVSDASHGCVTEVPV